MNAGSGALAWTYRKVNSLIDREDHTTAFQDKDPNPANWSNYCLLDECFAFDIQLLGDLLTENTKNPDHLGRSTGCPQNSIQNNKIDM